MSWYITAAPLLHIDAQKDPIPAILAAVIISVLLMFLVGAARRRETRRASRGRDLSGWRSRLPPQ